MGTENENNFETVVIEGEVWAVTSSGEGQDAGPDSVSEAADPTMDASAGQPDPSEGVDALETSESESSMDNAGTSGDAADQAEGEADASNVEAEGEADEIEFDAWRALTKLLVGGAIEGTSQLTRRLQQYEEELRRQAAEMAAEGFEAEAIEEDELVRLRYALVGLIFDAQATFRRNVSLWAKIADRSASATNRVAQPVTNSFIFNPVKRRYNSLVRRGEESLARWIADGRIEEPTSRDLARMTYVQILDEFIDKLAENPELQAVITKQSISVASDMRDEVRERTVTADNLVEGLVRRILRRTPRAELPAPPPEVQRWAGLSLDEYRSQKLAEDSKDES